MSVAATKLATHPRRYRIARVIEELADGEVFSWELEPLEEHAGEDIGQPGQFNMVYGFGLGEIPVSISAVSDGRLIHTIRSVGRVTRAMRAYKAGTEIGIRGPFGTTWPIAPLAERPVLVIAGGIGLAPLRPAIDALLEQQERSHPVTLLYGAKTPQTLLYEPDLQRWQAHPLCKVEITVDRADSDWQGHVGVVTKLLQAHNLDTEGAGALICGPEVMMRFCILALQQRGIANSDIYVSMERHMQCALGYCGHCQYGKDFMCRQGPVFNYAAVASRFLVNEL